MQCGLKGTHNFSLFALTDMAIDVPTKANSRTAVFLKSQIRATALCKQSQKNPQKQLLISGMAVSTSYGGIATRTAVHLSFAGTAVLCAYGRTAVPHNLQTDPCHPDQNHKC